MKNIVHLMSILLFVNLATLVESRAQAPVQETQDEDRQKSDEEVPKSAASTDESTPEVKEDTENSSAPATSQKSTKDEIKKKTSSVNESEEEVSAALEKAVVFVPQSLDEARELLGQGGLKYREYQRALFTLSLLGDETEKENALSILVRTSDDLAKDLEPFAKGHDAKTLSLLNARLILVVEERGELDDALLFWSERKKGVLRFLVVADDLNRVRFVGVRNQAGKQKAVPVILGEMQRIQVKEEYDLTLVILDAQKNELRQYPLGDATTSKESAPALEPPSETETNPETKSSSLWSVTGTSMALVSLASGVVSMGKLTSLDSAREEEGRLLWLGLTVGSAALFVGGVSLTLLAED